MNSLLPDCYDSLSPYRELFRQGLPILIYHKLGPRPAQVRLKGLYLSRRLFARQMAELKQAGFETITLDQVQEPFQDGRIILTFDDGFANVLAHGLETLAHHRFRAIQFLVADFIGKTNTWDLPEGETPAPLMDAVQVREWLAAGHQIGSHSLTHPFLTRISLAQAREEIAASKRKLEDQFGRPIDHFCHPYGDWNEAIRDLVAEAGYRTASTTLTGVNTTGFPPLALRRITVRYRSRNWKNFRLWLASLLRSGSR